MQNQWNGPLQKGDEYSIEDKIVFHSMHLMVIAIVKQKNLAINSLLSHLSG